MEIGFKRDNVITLSWHFYSKEFKELQRLHDRSSLLQPKGNIVGVGTPIDGLMVY